MLHVTCSDCCPVSACLHAWYMVGSDIHRLDLTWIANQIKNLIYANIIVCALYLSYTSQHFGMLQIEQAVCKEL